MGCSLHMFTEILIDWKKPAKWVNCDNYRVHEFFEREFRRIQVYNEYDSDLFGILGKVGYESHNKPISEPKGLPKNMSKHTKAASYSFLNVVAHSRSWFTVKELKNYLINAPPITQSGFITLEQAKALAKGNLPNDWCQIVLGNHKQYIWKEWINNINPVTHLVNALEKHMKEVLPYGEDPKDYYDKFRIVFWFTG